MVSEEKIAFIVGICLTSALAIAWYFVFFKGYDKKFIKFVIYCHEDYETAPKLNKMWNHPVAVKIAVSVFLIVSFFFLYLASRDFFNQ